MVFNFIVTLALLNYILVDFASAITCTTGWTLVGTYCYYILPTNNQPMNDAYRQCAKLNSSLPTFSSLNDFNVFDAKYHPASKPDWIWLGYAHDVGVMGPSDIVSLYDGSNPAWMTWLSPQPDMAGDNEWCVHRHSVGNHIFNDLPCVYNMGGWAPLNLLSICQQGQTFDNVIKQVGCSALCYSKTLSGNRYSTSAKICKRKSTVMNDTIGYAMTLFVPGISAPIYEVNSSTTSNTLMVYDAQGLSTLTPDYVIANVFYVATVNVTKDMAQYVLLKGTTSGKPDSMILLYNSLDYVAQLKLGWKQQASFYLFVKPDNNKFCSFATDCEWSTWQAWSGCSVTCGGGNRSKTRSKTVVESNGGACADQRVIDYEICGILPCPCVWNQWSPWSICTRTCGTGTANRARTKLFPEQSGGVCNDVYGEIQNCSTNPCPVDCEWSTWQSWSDCSVTCGGGNRTKTRSKNVVEIHGGTGVDGRVIDFEICGTLPCPCDWNHWSDWSNCTKTCGTGITNRTRTKLFVEHNGGVCDTVYDQIQNCSTHPCPIDCVFSDWKKTAECSVTCNSGYEIWTRTISVEAEFGGKNCTDSTTENRICQKQQCYTGALATLRLFECLFLVFLISGCFVLFLCLRIFTFERYIHMSQEVSLVAAHILISFFAFKFQADNMNPNICKPTAILLQYFFLVYYTFLFLECLQSYCIVTNVCCLGGFLPLKYFMLLGWGMPAALTTIMAVFFHDQYVSEYSCWINWSQNSSASIMIYVYASSHISVVFLEAGTKQIKNPLPLLDKGKWTAAIISLWSMVILLPLNFASWYIGSVAVYENNIYIHSVVIGVNVSLAIFTVKFHISGDEKVEDFFRKYFCCCLKEKKNYESSEENKST